MDEPLIQSESNNNNVKDVINKDYLAVEQKYTSKTDVEGIPESLDHAKINTSERNELRSSQHMSSVVSLGVDVGVVDPEISSVDPRDLELKKERSVADERLKKGLREKQGGQERFTRERKLVFLEWLSKLYPNVWKACAMVGVHKTTVLTHMQIDPWFGKECSDIADRTLDQVEGYMQTYAAEPKGFMDRIAILRAGRPEKWNPTSRLEMMHKRDPDETAMAERRAVLAKVVAEDADVIEAVTGKHVAALPARAEDVPVDLDSLAAMADPFADKPEPATPTVQANDPNIPDGAKKHDPSNARAGVLVNGPIDAAPARGYTQRMILDPFILSRTPKKNSPPKKTNADRLVHTTPPPSPRRSGKKGRVVGGSV